MFKNFGKILSALVCLLTVSVGSAMATVGSTGVDLTGVTMNTDDVKALMPIILVGLAALWGFRKLVKTTNRS